MEAIKFSAMEHKDRQTEMTETPSKGSISNPVSSQVNPGMMEEKIRLGGVGEGSAIGDLFDVNGAEFWNHWVDAGGDMDAYVKDNLPSYGLVGALLLTITYPYVLEPPGIFAAGGPEQNSRAATTFVVMMVICTLMNFMLIIMSIVIYTQYCCCVNDTSRLRFTGHFGYLVPAMVMLIVFQMALLAVATGLAIWANSSPTTLYASVAVFAAITVLMVGLVVWIPMWNQKYNYVDEVAASAKEKKQGKKET